MNKLAYRLSVVAIASGASACDAATDEKLNPVPNAALTCHTNDSGLLNEQLNPAKGDAGYDLKCATDANRQFLTKEGFINPYVVERETALCLSQSAFDQSSCPLAPDVTACDVVRQLVRQKLSGDDTFPDPLPPCGEVSPFADYVELPDESREGYWITTATYEGIICAQGIKYHVYPDEDGGFGFYMMSIEGRGILSPLDAALEECLR